MSPLGRIEDLPRRAIVARLGIGESTVEAPMA
jgi:hypothetical protein